MCPVIGPSGNGLTTHLPCAEGDLATFWVALQWGRRNASSLPQSAGAVDAFAAPATITASPFYENGGRDNTPGDSISGPTPTGLPGGGCFLVLAFLPNVKVLPLDTN